jgi:hypothetical protein
MGTVLRTASNGVSFGTKYTVTAQDVSDGSVIIDFQTDFDMVASIAVRNPADADPNAPSPTVDLGDANISYPANGQVKIANGDSTFTLVAGYVIDVVACRAKSE